MHDGDLTRRPPEVDEPELHPEPEGFPEADRLGLRLHSLRGFCCHLHLLHLMTGQLKIGDSVTTVTLRCQGSERRGTPPILTISCNCGYSVEVLRYRREHGRNQTSTTLPWSGFEQQDHTTKVPRGCGCRWCLDRT